jgi:hypothetical protein
MSAVAGVNWRNYGSCLMLWCVHDEVCIRAVSPRVKIVVCILFKTYGVQRTTRATLLHQKLSTAPIYAVVGACATAIATLESMTWAGEARETWGSSRARPETLLASTRAV